MTPYRFRTLAEGLRFPEGPALLADGTLLFVEVERGTLVRLAPGGRPETVAFLGGGPNGLAIGPDGAAYVCNNGGFLFHEEPGMLRPIGTPDSYVGGSIQRVDLATGEVRTLYGGERGPFLKGPNDLVFDALGNFWFTDMGKTRDALVDRARLFYASPDGKSCREVVKHMLGANGIGLSPDEKALYVAETVTGRLWQFDVTGPGAVAPRPWPSPHGGRLLHGSANYQFFDSMAIEAGGNICVGTLVNGGITVVSPAGELVEFVATPDVYATNLCFGGEGGRTAYITLSTTGKIVATDWPRAGIPARY
ncbi:MAG TPA: SMP-30/gluconolactonase/LRE family protein [Usitatibacteraceae bacterium]|nr:SMP-30/gluconolactonase/LRE family protein [Usitatibacteraceae bacterium]